MVVPAKKRAPSVSHIVLGSSTVAAPRAFATRSLTRAAERWPIHSRIGAAKGPL